MALNQKIRLQIISALDDAGIKATAAQLDSLQAKVTEAQTATKGLGKEFSSAFNPMEAVMSVAHGNVEGMTKAMVQLGLAVKGVTLSVGAMTGVFGGIMLAVTGVKKLIELFDEQKRAAKEAADATATAFSTNVKNAITAFQAEYKLAMEASANPGETRKKFIERQKQELSAMGDQLASYERQAVEKIDAKRKELWEQRRAEIQQRENAGYAVTDEQLYTEGNRRRINRELEKWQRKNDGDLYGKEIGALVKAIGETDKNIKKMEQEATDEQNKAVAEREMREQEMADKIKAIQESAKMEEMKLEEERHRQRMKNLEAEANAARADLSNAKGRFEKEFSLYKNKDALVKQIEAEKQDDESRKQLAKDARRYGNKWQIDELAKLYASGDEEGVRAKLGEWRKRKSFTPEVEAMVRASAAGQNVKTLEDRVSEIAENTKGLADKVDQLLSMKGE